MPAIPGSDKITQSAQQEEDDSADDEDFLANIEELPDTEEEDELQAEDSDEPPYEPETDVLHLRGDGASVASGTPIEASVPGEGGRNKRRRLSAGTPVSDTTAPPSSSWGRQLPAAAQFAAPVAATAAQAQIYGAKQQQRNGWLPQQQLGLQQQVPNQSDSLSSLLLQHAQLPPLQQQYMQSKQYSNPAEDPKGPPMQPVPDHAQQQPGQLAGQQQQQHAAPRHQYKQPVPQPHPHRASQLAHQQQRPPLRSQHQSPTATSATAATPSLSGLESANAPQHDDAGNEAICLRTRSKHPLASEEFDPDMFDRLLAEFDPDVEPLIDDAMYQQFLQSLQSDGATGNQFPLGNTFLSTTGPTADLDPTAIASLAGTGVVLPSAPVAPAATGGLTFDFPVTVPAGAAVDDDDDDEEFQLDPLDWLLDDERDAEEEERLAQLVQVQAQMAAVPGHQEGLAAGGREAGDRRRSQRGAARRAADRIAQKQQQQMMLSQQQQQLQQQAELGGGVAGNHTYVQPLIPATAAGWPLSAAATDHPGAAMPLPHAQPQHLSLQDSLLQPSMDAMQPMHLDLQHQQEQYLNLASGAAISMPQLLTLTDNQVKQLYQQVSLHTQLLTQLYVLTARDPSPTAQALASSAGQMLGDIKRLHAAAEGSYRGGQLAELLQQAFFQSSSSTAVDAAHEAADAAADSQGSDAATAAAEAHVWRPPISDMTTVWDTVPLRLLDDVVPQLRVTTMCGQPLLERLQQQEQAAAKEAKKMINTVLGPICKGPGGYDASAWPVLAPRGKAGIWTTAEDDLLWLGIIRFHNAVRPLQDTAHVISQEILPPKSAASICTRYKNFIRRRIPTAEVVLKYAFVGKERPTSWELKDPIDNQDHRDPPAASVRLGPRTSRGPMWAAAELGAALTAAFAAAELGLPSAAAAAAAGVLLQDSTAASAAAGGFAPEEEPHANQAVSSGEQLLQDFTAATSLRWPFVLAAALEVPSAKSMRRAPQSLHRTVDQAAGEHLLLSLAARQILQGDPEAAEAATLAGDDTAHGADPAAAGVPNSNGLLAGLFPSGACNTQQQVPSATHAVGMQQQGSGGAGASAIGSLTALLQASPAARDRSARSPPAAAGTVSPGCQAAAVAAGTYVVAEGAAVGDHNLPSPSKTSHQQKGQSGTAGTATGTAVQQPPHHRVRQQLQKPAALQQGSICLTGGSLERILGLSNFAKYAGRKRRQLSSEAPLAAAAGAASYIKQTAYGSHQDGQQQQKQASRSGSSAAAGAVGAAAVGATAAVTVDTDDEDMDFGDPAAASTSVQQQQQDNRQHQQQHVPAHGSLPVHVTQQHVNRHRSSPTAATTTGSADNAADSMMQDDAGGGVGSKQLRRSLFGSQKAAAAASKPGPSGTQHTTLSRSKAASPPSAASPAPSAIVVQGAVAAGEVRGSSQQLIQQKKQQRQPRPLAPRASAALNAKSVGISPSRSVFMGQSVFSATDAHVAACLDSGSGSEPRQAASQIHGRFMAAAEGRAGASIPTGTSTSTNSLQCNIIGLSGLLSSTHSSTGGPNIHSKGRRLARQQLTCASALPPKPAMALGHLRAAVPVPSPAPGVLLLQDSVTARAARRLAEAEAQDAALLAATAAALPTAQLSSSTVKQQLQLGITGARAVLKRPGGRGGWRRRNLAPLNGCVLSSTTALRLGSSTPAAAGTTPASAGLSSIAAGAAAGRGATGVDPAVATHAEVSQLAVGSVAAVANAGQAGAQQAGSSVAPDNLLASLRSVLQLLPAVVDSNGTFHKQQQVQDQQQGSGPGLLSVTDLQALVSSLSQSLVNKHGNHHKDIDMQAVYAVLAAQQRQEATKQQCKLESQQSRIVHEQPIVSKQQQQEPVSPPPKPGSRTPGSARKQKCQRPQASEHVSNYAAPPKSQPQQKPQASASDSYCVLDCSALQALAEAAAKALRVRR